MQNLNYIVVALVRMRCLRVHVHARVCHFHRKTNTSFLLPSVFARFPTGFVITIFIWHFSYNCLSASSSFRTHFLQYCWNYRFILFCLNISWKTVRDLIFRFETRNAHSEVFQWARLFLFLFFACPLDHSFPFNFMLLTFCS